MDVTAVAEPYHPMRVFANKLAGYVVFIFGVTCLGVRYMPIALFFSALAMVRLWLREGAAMIAWSTVTVLLLMTGVLYSRGYLPLTSLALLMGWMWCVPVLMALWLRICGQWLYPLGGLAVAEWVLYKCLVGSAVVLEWQQSMTVSSLFVPLEPAQLSMIEPWFQLALSTLQDYGLVCYWIWVATLLVLGRGEQQPDWRLVRLPKILCFVLVGIVLLAKCGGTTLVDHLLYRMALMLLFAQSLALLVPKLETQCLHPFWALLILGVCLSIYPIVPWLAIAVGVYGMFGYGGLNAAIKKFVSGVK